VPLHPLRLRSKGYSQSALLAKALSKKLGLEMNQRLMPRTRNTAPQINASRVDRRDNVQGSFQCDGPVDNRAVILVDDVAPTGSTLSDCAAGLKAAGVASVWGSSPRDLTPASCSPRFSWIPDCAGMMKLPGRTARFNA